MSYKSCLNIHVLLNSIRPSRGQKETATNLLTTMLNVTMFQSRALTRCTPYTL